VSPARLSALLYSAAMTPLFLPRYANARQPGKLPTIGFLGATTPSVWSAFVAAFLQRLRELGWIDGSTVAIEYRWAQGRDELYAEFAAEFVRLKVDVILTAGTDATIAVMKTTSEIPIVFAAVGDPVGTGLVASLAHPGGNVTGLSNEQTDLAGYRLELLHEVIPSVRRVALLGNIGSPLILLEMTAAEVAAPKLGLEVFRLGVRKTEDIEPAIESVKDRADALYVCTDPLISTNRVSINILAIGEKLPTMNSFREYVQAGGLISYGPNFPDLFRRAGDFVDKILRGVKPADLPVEQPVKFDLMINATCYRCPGDVGPGRTIGQQGLGDQAAGHGRCPDCKGAGGGNSVMVSS
jgi:putative tryptophan/tyrosine transport system substrate-binding protein